MYRSTSSRILLSADREIGQRSSATTLRYFARAWTPIIYFYIRPKWVTFLIHFLDDRAEISSIKMPPTPGQEEPLKRMTKIVNSLLARQDCAPFREPVDWRGLELYDYPEIIDKMMDLGTIKRRLERGHYSTAHQVAEDIRLIWANCMTYNADGSDFWLLAKSYSRRFEDRYRKVKSECKSHIVNAVPSMDKILTLHSFCWYSTKS